MSDFRVCLSIQVELCKECIDWAKDEKRTFLRQALEVQFIFLLLFLGTYTLEFTELLTNLENWGGGQKKSCKSSLFWFSESFLQLLGYLAIAALCVCDKNEVLVTIFICLKIILS